MSNVPVERPRPSVRAPAWVWLAVAVVALAPLVLTAGGLAVVALRPVPQTITETACVPPPPPPIPVIESGTQAAWVEPGEARSGPKGLRPVAIDDEPSAPPPAEPTKCDKFGTTIDFVRSPAVAFDRAEREGKLVLVLHVAGHFEDPGFT